MSIQDNRNTPQPKTRTRNRSNIPLDIAGKVPPHARDLEEAVLGGLMLEKEKVDQVADILTPEHFYYEEHREIYNAISALYSAANPVDLLTVTNYLRNEGKLDLVGGPYYLAQLTSRVSSAANITYHARILTEKFIQRQLIKVGGDISSMAFDDSQDAFNLLDQAEKELYEIKNKSLKNSYMPIHMLMTKTMEMLESRKGGESGITGVPSGFSNLDRMTGGWQKSDLIILAARPGMGKTAMALSLARNAAVDHQKAVAIFSLEMADVQLVARLLSGEAEINNDQLKKGDLREDEWQQLHSRTTRLSTSKIFIDDTPQLSIFDLKAKCRRLHSQHNIEMVVIDYLQLIRSEDKNAATREQEISHISRSLKGLAKELDIPIIALAQLSREVEKRQDKRPMLSDLRESGSIEQDADMVLFIYRPDYYGNTQNESGEDNNGLSELIIAKHRNGATDIVPVRYINRFAKFVGIDEGTHWNTLSPMDTFTTLPSKMNDASDSSYSAFITDESTDDFPPF